MRLTFSNSPIYIQIFSFNLILVSFVTLNISRIHPDLFIILLESSHVLPSLRKLAFFHTLSNVPVDECPLGVHQVKLVVKPGPGLSNSRGIGQHADSSLNLGKITSWDDGRRLIIDSNLETSRTPVNKLDRPLTLNSGDSSIHILGDHVAPVEHAAGHVLAMPGVTLNHGIGRLKACIGYLSHGELLMVGLLSRDDGGIGDEREVDPGVGHQVGLEFIQVNVQSSIKPQGGGD